MENNRILAVNMSDDFTAVKVTKRNVSDMTVGTLINVIGAVIMMITLAVIVIVADFEKVIALLIFAGLVLSSFSQKTHTS